MNWMDSRPRTQDIFHSPPPPPPCLFYSSSIRGLFPLFSSGCTYVYTYIPPTQHTSMYISPLLFGTEEQSRDVIYHVHRKPKYQLILTIQTKPDTS